MTVREVNKDEAEVLGEGEDEAEVVFVLRSTSPATLMERARSALRGKTHEPSNSTRGRPTTVTDGVAEQPAAPAPAGAPAGRSGDGDGDGAAGGDGDGGHAAAAATAAAAAEDLPPPDLPPDFAAASIAISDPAPESEREGFIAVAPDAAADGWLFFVASVVGTVLLVVAALLGVAGDATAGVPFVALAFTLHSILALQRNTDCRGRL